MSDRRGPSERDVARFKRPETPRTPILTAEELLDYDDDEIEAILYPLRPGTFRASNGVTLALSAQIDFSQ